MDLHVFLILIPPPTCLPIPSLWVIPVHQPLALVSCIQPGLAICFTLDNILVSMLFSQIIPPSPSPIESKSLFYTSVRIWFSLLEILITLNVFVSGSCGLPCLFFSFFCHREPSLCVTLSLSFVSIGLHLSSNYYMPLEKAMAPHSSTLAWKIPWMGEPGRLQSMGLLSQT